ncbi:MAG: transcriptional repressor LexA [Oscillospiraceae bacterium]
MSDKKSELFHYLVNNSDGVPSVRELCAALSIKSTSSVHRMLHELEDDGLITIAEGKRRNISIVKERQPILVPLLGTVAAGVPILAQEYIEDYISFDSPRSISGELFALHVKGDSMINAGILDGDIIIARRVATAEDGEIVVALIEDEATVKKIYRHKNHIELRAENPAFSPIIAKEVSVLGTVVACVRYYDQ